MRLWLTDLRVYLAECCIWWAVHLLPESPQKKQLEAFIAASWMRDLAVSYRIEQLHKERRKAWDRAHQHDDFDGPAA